MTRLSHGAMGGSGTWGQVHGMRVVSPVCGLTHIRNKAWNEPLLQNRIPVHVVHVGEVLNVRQVREPLVGVGLQELSTR